VTDFPMFERDPETGRPAPAHHPFTLPDVEDPERLREAPMEVTSRAYDVVYNGHELCSGSLRCHDPGLQRAIFDVLGLGRDDAEERFGFLLEAFRRGVPPHGGFALGLDRTVMLMVGATSTRDVIAFPKTTAGRALLEGAPSPVAASELDELGLGTTGDEETDPT
ncbi:MAG: amino acid--tRNA ligase-related protein, partial [Gemmatimonadota bacterium]